MLLKNNINLILQNLSNNIGLNPVYYYTTDSDNLYNATKLNVYNSLNIYIDLNLSYNIMIKDIIKPLVNKILKLKYSYNNKLKKEILNVQKTSLQLKDSKNHKFKLITCLGSGDKWVGIGKNEGKLFKKSFVKSINTSKKYIYNLNFKCNDYKYLNYKGCKFRAINMTENRKNLKIYENITKVSGDKRIKLISYSSKTPINIIKSILYCF